MTRRSKSGLLLFACLALLVGGNIANAEFMKFDVIPAFAPQGPQSPSWNGYVFNAIAGVQSNVDVGDRAVTPEATTSPESWSPHVWIATDFIRWRRS